MKRKIAGIAAAMLAAILFLNTGATAYSAQYAILVDADTDHAGNYPGDTDFYHNHARRPR